jgi:SNF2 family DNA or RNA helicase
MGFRGVDMPVVVELDPDTGRIVLRSPFYVGVNDQCKRINGYKFDDTTYPDEKVWTYPLRMQTCTALRAEFKDALQIGPHLWAWAKVEAGRDKERLALASKPDSDLSRVKESHPALWDAMSTRPYQRSGAEFVAYTGTAAILDEPGLGKTVEALAALIQAGVWEGRHLVIVSNKTAIESTWAREIMHWTPDAKVYPMPDGMRNREEMLWDFEDDVTGARFLICLPHMLQIKVEEFCKKCDRFKSNEYPIEHYSENHRTMQKDAKMDWPELFDLEWDSVIADECHDYLLKLGPPQTKHQPQWAHGMRRLKVREGGCKIPMTGTPFRGKEEKIFGILHWMDPIRFSSKWGFVGAYMEVTQGYGNSQIVGRLRPESAKAFYDVIDSLCLRRTRKEVRDDLPDILPQEHWVVMDGKHKKQYEEFEEEAVALLDDGVLEGLGTLSELTRLKQLAFGPHNIRTFKRKPRLSDFHGPDRDSLYENAIDSGMMIEDMEVIPLVKESPKVQLMLDMLRERGVEPGVTDDGMKFIIASQYTKVIDELEKIFAEMAIPTLKITGSVTGKARSAAVTSFNRPGGARILLMNTKAGGASLTLDAYCDEMFIMDETWVHDDIVQLMGRINNRGKRIAVRIFHFFRTEGTIDERVAIQNDEQNEMQSRILDGRRGRQFAISLLRRNAK